MNYEKDIEKSTTPGVGSYNLAEFKKVIPGGKFDTKRDENDKTLPWKINTNIGPGSYALPKFMGNQQTSVSRVSNSRAVVMRHPVNREKGSLSAERSTSFLSKI